MATVWVNRRNQETQQPQRPQYQNYQAQESARPTQGYTGLAGVSNSTAKQTQQAQQAYQPGQAVTQAQQQLQQMQAQKPQGYNSKYGAQLDSILQQIQNPEQFKYEFNGDNLFKAYSDLYTQKGKQASMDAMGQAAGLTGGYGNSYAQMAGNQAYQQYLLGLYDKGMDLYDRAYQAYGDRKNDLYNRYQMLQGADESAYGRYRDTVGDWQNERNYLTDMYNTEADRDYNRYINDRDYWTGLAQVENADYRTEQERQEAIRQYEQNFAEQVYRADQDEAYRRDTLNWQQDTDQRDYDRAVLESDRDYLENVLRADQDEAYRRDTLAWNQAESQRNYDRAVLENNRDYDRAALESDRNFAEQVRQAELDEAYRRDTFGWQQGTDQRDYDRAVLENDRDYKEQVRQADLDEAYRRDTFNWQKETDQRDYDRAVEESDRAYEAQVKQAEADNAYRQATLEEDIRQFNESLDWDKMSSDQKYAYQYVMGILENGEMPSDELLAAAGLSAEDAEKLKAIIEEAASGSPGPKENTKTYQNEKYRENKEESKDEEKKYEPKSTDWTPTGLSNKEIKQTGETEENKKKPNAYYTK